MSVRISEISEQVCRVIDPQGRGRQFVEAYVRKHVGTRIAGFVLTDQRGVGKWSVTTYLLQRTSPNPAGNPPEHRGHRGHRGADTPQDAEGDLPPNEQVIL